MKVNFNDLLKKIKKFHWVWFWSGNWPLLDSFYERDKGFCREFKKLTGIKLNICVDFFSNGTITAYHNQEEYDRIERGLRKNLKKNSKYIEKTLSQYHKKTSAQIKKLKEINKIKPHNLSNERLANLFLKSRKYFSVNSSYDFYCWYIEKFFVPDLENYLIKRLKEIGRPEKLSDYLTKLVAPVKLSRVFKERTKLYRLVRKIRKNEKIGTFLKSTRLSKEDISKFEEKFPLFSKIIDTHLKEFSYLPVLVNNPPVSKKDILIEIKSFVKNKKDFVIQSRRMGDNFEKRTKHEAMRIVTKLKPDKKTRQLVRDLRENAFIRTEDNAVMGLSTYLLIPLFKEITQRLGITYTELKEFTPEEIAGYLRKNRKADKDLLRERLKLTANIVFRGERFVYNREKAKRLKDLIEKQLESDKLKIKTNEFKGVPANSGKVVGKVRVCLSSKESNNIKKGEILIAPATSADFVPAMRLSGAIITEFGGITSHAGVVAREFDIPCLVSVNQITKILKDGDKVEVDANQGMVRKIN